MKIILLVKLFIVFSAGVSFGDVMDDWKLIYKEIKKENPDHKGGAQAAMLKRGVLLLSSLKRKEKIELLKKIAGSKLSEVRVLLECLVIDAVKNDDSILLQTVLEKSQVPFIGGLYLFEYLASVKNGRYVAVILGAYKKTENLESKKMFLWSLSEYFGERKKAIGEGVYLERCIDDFYNNNMWESKKIKEISLF